LFPTLKKINSADPYYPTPYVFVCYVQVTGELSNNYGPMRRFMQTFVLARQSPKMFYLHNDIFRYQDEVFHDSDTPADFGDQQHVTGEY